MQRFNHNTLFAIAVAGLTIFGTTAAFAHGGGGGGHSAGRSSGRSGGSHHSSRSSGLHGSSHLGTSSYRSLGNLSRTNPRNPGYPRWSGYAGLGINIPGIVNNNPPVAVLTGTYTPGTNNNPPVTVVTGNYPGTPPYIPPGTIGNNPLYPWYPGCPWYPGFPRCPLPHRHWVHYHFHGLNRNVDTADVRPIDVETIAIRFIDAGDASQGTGPAYRVTVRNNSDVAIDDVFDLTLAASNSAALPAGVPTATTWIDGMAPLEVRDFDIRLPVSVDTMGQSQAGQPTPFSILSAMADSQYRLVETDKANNLLVMNRTDIQSISDD
jgi:hypothetical protein